ncbi:MAG TPA: hypothetical protein VKT83_18925 [bacterium]|nr:hypothetical protein [bacterium]
MMDISRRDLFKAGALAGTGVLLGSAGPRLISLAATKATQDPTATAYALARPENILYGACLQCNTQCTLKVKMQDGLLVKIDGSAYSPMTLQPHLAYGTPLDAAAKGRWVDLFQGAGRGADAVRSLPHPQSLEAGRAPRLGHMESHPV